MKKILITLVLTATFACNSNDDVIIQDQASQFANTFIMIVNDSEWTPSLLGENPCYSNFSCFLTTLNGKPFYTIKATKESKNRTETLKFQVMEVEKVGTYNLKEEYDRFSSYAQFIVKENGKTTIYENHSSENLPKVIIDKIIFRENSNLTGIKGTFFGTFHNKYDLNDSFVIENCQFKFERVNRSDNDHCK